MDSDREDVPVPPSEDTGMQEWKKRTSKLRGRGSDRHHGAFEGEEIEGIDEEIIDEEEEASKVPSPSVDGWLIFVKNLHDEITEQDLKDKFIDYGKIKGINVHINRMTGYPMGTAVIEFAKYTAAAKAIKDLNGKTWMNKTLQVDWCFLEKGKKTKE